MQKIRGNPHLQKTNYGYDDDRGDYQVTPRDHIAYRYEVQSVLGKGSFGQVLKVLDYKTGSHKALKIIRNKKRFHHQVTQDSPNVATCCSADCVTCFMSLYNHSLCPFVEAEGCQRTTACPATAGDGSCCCRHK